MRLLLLSNSTNHGSTMFAHAGEALVDLVGTDVVTFVPYALADWDGYADRVAKALGAFDIDVVSAHRSSAPDELVLDARVVLMGGGNSFRLLDSLYGLGVLEGLGARVRDGSTRYVGASAGTNVACPTIRTTNDMPICVPPSLVALELVPFQINLHYVDADRASTFMGETRDERIEEFLEENHCPVLAMYEGAWLQVSGKAATVTGRARLFERDGCEGFDDGVDVSELLDLKPIFDGGRRPAPGGPGHPPQRPLGFPVRSLTAPRTTAVVYCEGSFGCPDGKTANGLVRHSERFEILSVIDSERAGLDAGQVLDGTPSSIPICTDLADAVAAAGRVPDAFIFGMAPASGMLSPAERRVVLDAVARGMDIVNGLHEFLNDDPEIALASAQHGVTIFDVRRPRDKKDLRMFSGRIGEVTCPRIAVLGTDGAIGKRTTATILTAALNDAGIKAVLVGTGQTGLIQGALYGVALDAIPCQFCSGEMEATVVEAFEGEDPDVIIIEGQGALSHPAYLTSSFILRGSRPHAVILQHAPARTVLGDFPSIPMPTAASEISLIQAFAITRVIGLAINHEDMTDAEVTAAITHYESELGIPATDPLTRPVGRLVEMVLLAFPALVGIALATAT